MIRLLRNLAVFASILVLALGAPIHAQNNATDTKTPARSQSKDAAAESHTPISGERRGGA